MKGLNEQELLLINGGNYTEVMNTIQKGYYYVTYALASAKRRFDGIFEVDNIFGDSVPFEKKA